MSLPSRQLRRRSHAAVPVAEVLAVVEVSMVAALTSPAAAFVAAALAFVAADSAAVDSVAVASDLGLRLA